VKLVFLKTPHTLSKPRKPAHSQNLLNKCGWLSQVDRFVKTTLQKTSLLFESFRNKADKGIGLQNRFGTKAHGANKMLVQWPGSVSSLLSVSLFILCRGTGRNWSGLTFRFAPFLSPPIPATAQTQTISMIKTISLLIIFEL